MLILLLEALRTNSVFNSRKKGQGRQFISSHDFEIIYSQSSHYLFIPIKLKKTIEFLEEAKKTREALCCDDDSLVLFTLFRLPGKKLVRNTHIPILHLNKFRYLNSDFKWYYAFT